MPNEASLVASTARLRYRPASHLNSSCILNGRVEIPINRLLHSCAPLPAASFPGGFRTTAPVRAPSSRWPSSETLHIDGRDGRPLLFCFVVYEFEEIVAALPPRMRP